MKPSSRAHARALSVLAAERTNPGADSHAAQLRFATTVVVPAGHPLGTGS
ncbi:hypothetical protein [Streptomyces sp. NPDC001389]